MMVIPDKVFWIFNAIIIIMLLFSMAFGWKHGGKRMLWDILKTIIQIIITVLATYFLTTHYSLFNEQKFYDYMDWMRVKTDLNNATSPYSAFEVNKVRFIRSGYIWFFVALVSIEIIMSIIIHIYRKRHKNDKKPIGKTDHVIGEILGGFLILFWFILLSPIFISLEKVEVFSNGSDLVNKTVLKYPVNYVAKPLTKLILGDNPASRVYDDGLSAITQGIKGFDVWIADHCENVTEVADLTALMSTAQKASEEIDERRREELTPGSSQ